MTITKTPSETSAAQAAQTTEGEKYRFDRLSLPLILADMRYRSTDPKAGDQVPPFDLPTTDGGRFSSTDLGERPILMFFGSLTCPISEASGPGLNELHSTYGDRVRFVAVNVREAHPGEKIGQPRSGADKEAHAGAFQDHHGFTFETAVDDIDGSLHRTMGPKPNSAYLIASSGVILFRAQWATDTRALDQALSAVVTGSPLPRTKVSRTMPNIVGSMGYIPEVLDNAGPSAKRDMWRTAPPMAAMAALTRAFGWVPRARRGWVAMAAIATAVAAVAVVAVLAF